MNDLVCQPCAYACALDEIQNCDGYDGELDLQQLCECQHCENYDDFECWSILFNVHNKRCHSIEDCDVLDHKELNDAQRNAAFMADMLSSGKTALLL